MPRALHWVFKVPQRESTAQFYRQLLGMRVLRHEEFQQGCDAACNGPYDGRWSKSMVGYGPESSHFVVELTYNYGIKKYTRGNDNSHITVKSTAAYQQAKALAGQFEVSNVTDEQLTVAAPGGYPFVVINSDVASGDPVQSVTLNISNLERSLAYWRDLLGMSVLVSSADEATLSYGAGQASLVLRKIADPIRHEEAFGRIAFSCPAADLPGIQAKAEGAGHKVLTPLISLDTPGKATVQVVILADPDGYEICFVGDEAFSQLSQVDPQADALIDAAIKEDGSDAWFEKREAARQRAEERQKAAAAEAGAQ